MYRSAYPAPILPMDAHDRAFAERHTSRATAHPKERENLRAGVHPDRQPLFIRIWDRLLERSKA
jgi:hypothetical protein